MQDFEALYTFKEIAGLWRCGQALVRKHFRGCPGVMNVATGETRPAYRVPASVVLDVMLKLGYTREQAEAVLRRGAVNAA